MIDMNPATNPVVGFFVIVMKDLLNKQGDDRIKCAYVLAGGQSRRMGRDKLFLEVEGKSLLMRTLDVCQFHFDEIKIVAKESEKFAEIDYPIVTDWPGADGPLAGIIAALIDCSGHACFVTAVDLYDLDSDIITKLLEKRCDEDYFGLSEHGSPQPLCGVYSKSALEDLRLSALTGNYEMKSILASLNARYMQVPSRIWRNMNSPVDLPCEGL